MDIKNLEVCNVLAKEIIELREFIEVLKNPYVNQITGHRWRSGEETKVFYILDGELRDIVIDYLKNKLELKENEFKEL